MDGKVEREGLLRLSNFAMMGRIRKQANEATRQLPSLDRLDGEWPELFPLLAEAEATLRGASLRSYYVVEVSASWVITVKTK